MQSKRDGLLCGVLSEGKLVKQLRYQLFHKEREDNVYGVAFFIQVLDGTECRPHSSSVCVKGKCIRTGCDSIIGSKLQFDKCGICGGDNKGCIRVVGNFTKKR